MGRGKADRTITMGPSVAMVLTAISIGLAGCSSSGDVNQFPNQKAGEYRVDVVRASFPERQEVAKTYEMVIEVRNAGAKTIPAINVSVNLPGRNSTLAFAARNDQVGIAAPQRPVWVLEEGYPKLAGTVGRGGAATSSRRTFQFGELEPGEKAVMIWRVTAVEPGDFDLSWTVEAGLAPGVNAVDRSGETPRGLFGVKVANRAVLTRIDENGKVVPITPQEQRTLEMEEANSTR